MAWSIGTVLVTMPTIDEITRPSARLQVQNFSEPMPSRKLMPGSCARASCRVDAAALGSLNHSRISGSSTSRLSSARITKAARQSHSSMPQAIRRGTVAAVTPVPDRPMASARPRFRSYQRLISWVQVTASAPMPTIGSSAKARYIDQIDELTWVVAR
ncbi:hypothetical protein D3C79_853780 [compost metagenome]